MGVLARVVCRAPKRKMDRCSKSLEISRHREYFTKLFYDIC